jgi:hypothetical protein
MIIEVDLGVITSLRAPDICILIGEIAAECDRDRNKNQPQSHLSRGKWLILGESIGYCRSPSVAYWQIVEILMERVIIRHRDF